MSDRRPIGEEFQYRLTVIIGMMVFIFLLSFTAMAFVSTDNAAERRALLQVACINAGGNWNDLRVECVSPLPIPVRPSV
jgi:hypothetical protein